jgi:outer membrane biosynthesis protein TonB
MATGRTYRPARNVSGNYRQGDTGRIGVGVPTSMAIHVGIALAALVAWQTTPPMTDPNPVIPVDIISEVPITPTTEGETDGTGPTGVGDMAMSDGGGEPAPAAAPDLSSVQTEALPAPDPGLPPTIEPAAAPAPAPPPPPVARALPPPPPTAKTPPPKAPPPQAVRPQPQRPQPQRPPPPPPPAAARPQPARPQPRRPAQPTRPTQPARPAANQQAARANTQPAAQPAAAPGAQVNRSRDTSLKFDVPGASSGAGSGNANARTGPNMGGAESGRAGGRNGNGAQLSGDLRGMLRSQISETYTAPSSMRAGERIVVILAITLDRDGRLRGAPRLVSATGSADQALTQNAVETAMRAVQQRRQFDLPEDRFSEWQSFQFRFDPQELIN